MFTLAHNVKIHSRTFDKNARYILSHDDDDDDDDQSSLDHLLN